MNKLDRPLNDINSENVNIYRKKNKKVLILSQIKLTRFDKR